jgi:hypothetical protein
MYYETKLKPIVDEKYAEYLEETPKEHQENRIAFAAVLVAKLFEQETPEIKAEVEPTLRSTLQIRIFGSKMSLVENSIQRSN